MTEEKSSVKEMLIMDITLKQELTAMFKDQSTKLHDQSRKQSAILVLVSFCTALVIIIFMFYITRPNPIDRMVFEAIQNERRLIRQEREAVRIERDSIKILRLNKTK